jgi:two-component system CheB/CheR fusion protein
MAREGLRPALSSSLHTAALTKELVRATALRVKTNGDFSLVNLRVCPVPVDDGDSEVLLLVILELAERFDLEQPRLLATTASEQPSESPALEPESQMAALKEQLRAKEELLRTANEELETINEALRCSNEEMQSVNEELQSTNEELETSKEELQSVNEELVTVNGELQTKVADLTQANNDMNNLLAGTGIGTVFVDHQLKVLRFTPAVTHIINLISSDAGRPLGHIVSNLVGYERLVIDARAVLDTLIPKELEVQTISGECYTMRILPYRTLDNVIEGVVITFFDITLMKATRDALRESEKKFRGLFENTTSAVALHDIVLDDQGQPVDCIFLEANLAFENYTGVRASDLQGKRLSDVFPDIRKTNMIETLARVALSGESATFESSLDLSSKRYLVTAYQVGLKRVAAVFTDLSEGQLSKTT